MDERAKRIPPKLAPQVLHSNPSPDEPDVSWIRERKVAIRVSRRFIQQPLVFWITTDHPVQCDDVGGNKLTGTGDKSPWTNRTDAVRPRRAASSDTAAT